VPSARISVTAISSLTIVVSRKQRCKSDPKSDHHQHHPSGAIRGYPTSWLFNIAKERDDADFEIVDLRDYPMPFFEEKAPLHQAPPQNEVALRWGKKIASLDGYIFVTAEYNHAFQPC